ncbi:MAG: two-component regulator propeller domain-containing protein [Bacteroidota bacterium]
MLLPVALLHAQPQPRAFAHLTTDDGLSSNVGVTIVQDAQGFIWIGTDQGLNRYDGRQVKVFRHDPADSTSLDFNNVMDLHLDAQGRLWASTHSGVLHRYHPETESFTRYPLPRIDGTGTVVEIHESQDGSFWLGTWQRGLIHFHPERGVLAHYRSDPDDPTTIGHPVVKEVLENPDGTLWLATYAGLNHFDPQTGRATRYPIPSQPDRPETGYANAAWEVHRDRMGNLWVGTFGGLYRFAPETETFVAYLPEPGSPKAPSRHEVHRIIEDHEGHLWIGYDEGLDRFDPKAGLFERMQHDARIPTSLQVGYVTALHQDRSGVLWVGTDRGGVSRADLTAQRIAFHHAHAEDGTEAGLIEAVYEDRDGTLWLGSESGVLRVDRETGQVEYRDNAAYGVPSAVTAFWEDRDGSLWAAFYGEGVGRMRPNGTFDVIAFEDAYDNLVNTAIPARAGGAWLGGYDGFFHWSPITNRITPFRSVLSATSNAVRRHSFVMALVEDRGGIVWAGTDDGLRSLDPATGGLADYEHDAANPTSIQPGGIRTLHEAADGTLWAAGPFGLSRLDNAANGRFTRYAMANGRLPTNTIHGLLEDDDGALWLHTDIGILRFDSATGDVRNAEPHIVGLPIDVSIGAFHRGASGTLYFGTLNGYYAFAPQELAPNPHPPAAVLTALRVADAPVQPFDGDYLTEAITVADDLQLDYADRLFAIDFAALHYSQPQANTFTYQLDGFDPDWRGPTSVTSATYTNLDPGTYTFRVRAANSDGVWSPEAATLTVTIAPPWWLTLWFRLLAGLTGLGLLAGAYTWRIRSIQQQKTDLEDQVRDRTREIESQRLALERQARQLQEMDALKSAFFANTSHELRTPLTLIRGNLSDVIQSADHEITSEGQGHLGVAMMQTTRLQHLVEQLLDLSRLQSKQMHLRAQYRNARPFVADIVKAFTAVAHQRGLTLRLEPSETPAWLYADTDKLEKIVTNLIGNALKFTPSGGGEVTVALREATVGGDGLGTGSFVVIEVRDTGEGISAEALPYIFDRFYQADGSVTRTREGMGVGLSLAQELAALHGGEIRCRSTQGEGATFRVFLPKGRDHLADEEIIAPSIEAVSITSPGLQMVFDDATPSGDGAATGQAVLVDAEVSDDAKTILVVEDNAELRHYLTRHLGKHYRVLAAEDGQVGLQLAQQHRPDAIVSDVMMPKLDGLSLLRLLKDDPELALVPVLLLTARASTADERDGLEAEAVHYIAKPFDMEDLLLRIANVLKDRARMQARWQVLGGDGAVSGDDSALSVSASVPEIAGEDADFLRRVDAYVTAHLQDNDLTVKALASGLFMGDRTFRRRLQETTGMTAAAYIRRVRLAYAKRHLEQQQYATLTEAAAAVGFSNANYFSRLYQQTYGVAPSEVMAK